MALSYKEYVEMLKERPESPRDQLDTVHITVSALERKKKRKKRPYSRETLQNRLRK